MGTPHWGKFVSEKIISVKKNFVKKNYEEEFAIFFEHSRIMGCPSFAKLPTPLVQFCPILLDPPNPLKNRTSLLDVPLSCYIPDT